MTRAGTGAALGVAVLGGVAATAYRSVFLLRCRTAHLLLRRGDADRKRAGARGRRLAAAARGAFDLAVEHSLVVASLTALLGAVVGLVILRARGAVDDIGDVVAVEWLWAETERGAVRRFARRGAPSADVVQPAPSCWRKGRITEGRCEGMSVCSDVSDDSDRVASFSSATGGSPVPPGKASDLRHCGRAMPRREGPGWNGRSAVVTEREGRPCSSSRMERKSHERRDRLACVSLPPEGSTTGTAGRRARPLLRAVRCKGDPPCRARGRRRPSGACRLEQSAHRTRRAGGRRGGPR